MPEKNIDFGKFGARGIKGSDAVARQLDQLAGDIVTPVTAKRGLMARLHYLTTSDQGLAGRQGRRTHRDRPDAEGMAGGQTPSVEGQPGTHRRRLQGGAAPQRRPPSHRPPQP